MEEVKAKLLNEDLKKCSKCGTKKALSEFNVDRQKQDGHKFWCKKCESEYHKTKRLLLKSKQTKSVEIINVPDFAYKFCSRCHAKIDLQGKIIVSCSSCKTKYIVVPSARDSHGIRLKVAA